MTAQEFITSLPSKVDSATLEGLETTFHFDISGAGGGQYTVQVANGAIDVGEGMNGEAKCKVTTSADTLVGLVTGKVNPMMAVLGGKVKISNQGEMMKYAKIFGLM
ncbi:MAG: SCP2 sterol-binding domain-containing protein [Bacteroidota bacterium]